MDKVLGNVVCRLVAGVVGGLLRTGTSFALYEKFAQDIYTRLRTLFLRAKVLSQVPFCPSDSL